jgi:hypothetical protein
MIPESSSSSMHPFTHKPIQTTIKRREQHTTALFLYAQSDPPVHALPRIRVTTSHRTECTRETQRSTKTHPQAFLRPRMDTSTKHTQISRRITSDTSSTASHPATPRRAQTRIITSSRSLYETQSQTHTTTGSSRTTRDTSSTRSPI